MASIGRSVCRQFCSKASGAGGQESMRVLRNATGGRGLVESVHVFRNGRTIAAWHPEPSYPYELSKPLPSAEVEQSASLLKEEALRAAKSAFMRQRPEVAREELMRLTHTCKHRWFPRARDKRAKKTPMDRPFL